MDCSPPGSSVHGISQARILERVAISSSKGSSWPGNQTWVFCIGRWILFHKASEEAISIVVRPPLPLSEGLLLRTKQFYLLIVIIRIVFQRGVEERNPGIEDWDNFSRDCVTWPLFQNTGRGLQREKAPKELVSDSLPFPEWWRANCRAGKKHARQLLLWPPSPAPPARAG